MGRREWVAKGMGAKRMGAKRMGAKRMGRRDGEEANGRVTACMGEHGDG